MEIFSVFILGILIASSVAVSAIKNILGAVIVFMIYSLMMAILWQRLNAPDLAITEAAIGAGITTLLFVLSLRRIQEIKR